MQEGFTLHLDEIIEKTIDNKISAMLSFGTNTKTEGANHYDYEYYRQAALLIILARMELHEMTRDIRFRRTRPFFEICRQSTFYFDVVFQACIDDNLDMVEFLVKYGADVNRGDNEGWTPLHATASCGFLSIAK